MYFWCVHWGRWVLHPPTLPSWFKSLEFTLGFVPSLGLDKCIMTFIHHCSIIQSIFIALKILCVLPIYFLPTPSLPSLANTDCFTLSIVLPFPECHIVGIIWYVVFSDWLLSPSNMHLNSSVIFHGLITHFYLALNNIPLSRCASLFIHSPTKEHLGCFQGSAINMHMRDFVCT